MSGDHNDPFVPVPLCLLPQSDPKETLTSKFLVMPPETAAQAVGRPLFVPARIPFPLMLIPVSITPVVKHDLHYLASSHIRSRSTTLF